MKNNELYHYGRKGMKWGQHIFGKKNIVGLKVRKKFDERGFYDKVKNATNNSKEYTKYRDEWLKEDNDLHARIKKKNDDYIKIVYKKQEEEFKKIAKKYPDDLEFTYLKKGYENNPSGPRPYLRSKTDNGEKIATKLFEKISKDPSLNAKKKEYEQYLTKEYEKTLPKLHATIDKMYTVKLSELNYANTEDAREWLRKNYNIASEIQSYDFDQRLKQ